MGRYKLSEDAKEDLRRIYRYGVLTFDETQADRYYDALFERFAQIANEPYLYPSVDSIRPGYRRSVCGVDDSRHLMGTVRPQYPDKANVQAYPLHAYYEVTQFSTCNPGTRTNSRSLFVTIIQPSARACAANQRSLFPMIFPIP